MPLEEMDEIVFFEGIDDIDCPICDGSDIDWNTRHCIAVKKGKGGKCRCAEYAYGVRPPHVPTFSELCSRRGISTGNTFKRAAFKGGNSKMARDSGLLSPLSALGIKPQIFKQTLITGAIAAGGLWVINTVSTKVSNMLKLTGWSRNLMMLAMAGVAGGLAYKFTKKKEYALAIGIGPVLVLTLQLLGQSAVFAVSPTAGLGAITGERVPVFEPMAAPPIGITSASGLYTEPMASIV